MKLVIPMLNTLVETDHERNREGWLTEKLLEEIREAIAEESEYTKLKLDYIDESMIYEVTEDLKKSKDFLGNDVIIAVSYNKEFLLNANDLINLVSLNIKKESE